MKHGRQWQITFNAFNGKKMHWYMNYYIRPDDVSFFLIFSFHFDRIIVNVWPRRVSHHSDGDLFPLSYLIRVCRSAQWQNTGK